MPACQLASKRKDHSRLPIITNVLLDAIWPHNDPDSTIAISRKQTAFHLFLDVALKTVAYLRVSTRSQDLANTEIDVLLEDHEYFAFVKGRNVQEGKEVKFKITSAH